jgi:hypothetical protein
MNGYGPVIHGVCQDHGRNAPCPICRERNTPGKIVSVTTLDQRLVVLDDSGRLWEQARALGAQGPWEPLLDLWTKGQIEEWAKRGKGAAGHWQRSGA